MNWIPLKQGQRIRFILLKRPSRNLREVHKYWKGKTTSELATSYMAPEAIKAIEHNIFTPGNYFYNGVGHVTVKYEEVLAIGYEGIIDKAQAELDKCQVGDGRLRKKISFPERSDRYAVRLLSNTQSVMQHWHQQMAAECTGSTVRKIRNFYMIAQNCSSVPAQTARPAFYEACQSFWFVQQLLQVESSGHSISPGRFDQYMYPYYKADIG